MTSGRACPRAAEENTWGRWKGICLASGFAVADAISETAKLAGVLPGIAALGPVNSQGEWIGCLLVVLRLRLVMVEVD
jgi:hypothetical protein